MNNHEEHDILPQEKTSPKVVKHTPLVVQQVHIANADSHQQLSELARGEKEYGEKVYDLARDMLSKLLPQALPTEPTLLFTTTDPRSEGHYIGMLRNRHYITLNVRDNGDKQNAQRLYEDAFTLAHELVHQKHAETTGPKDFYQIDFDTLFTDEEISTLSAAEIISRMTAAHALTYRSASTTIFNPVIEGIATASELYLMKKSLEEAQLDGDKERYSIIKKIYKDKLHGMAQYRRQSKGLPLWFGQAGSYIIGTLDIVNTLANHFDFESLPEIFQSIDLKQCRKIQLGSQTYTEIIADPRKLPGLENSSKVQASFVTNKVPN